MFFENVFHGLTALGNGPSIAFLFAGALIGMILGVIPGLSGAGILSIILIFVYHIDLTGTLCLFLGTQAGSYYSASITSILLNTPAHPEAFAITFDGYPMARKGEPARALGISACSTCVGGFIGCLVLVGFYQFINDLPGLFHPPEYMALVTLAMLLVGTLGTDSVRKALISAGAGLVVASIGPAQVSGDVRFAFGTEGLVAGISLVALALGVFAVPQMIMIYGTASSVARQDLTGKEVTAAPPVTLERGFGRQLIGGVLETFRHWGTLILGGLVGAATGVVPGIGGFTANFLSYGIAQQTHKDRANFGTGIAPGIIAPEASSLSKEAGSMLPILGLGIPGSVGGALFLAALTIKDVRTGYGFTTQYPTVPYEIVWIIALSGLIGTIAGVLLGPQLAKITRVPGPLIVPFIFCLSVIGPFLVELQIFSVLELVVFGIVGLGLRRLRYPLASFILGLVLGPTFETNTYLTHKIWPGLSFVTARPFADAIFAIAAIVLIMKARELHRENLKQKAEYAGELEGITDEETRAAVMRLQQQRRVPYPLLSLIMTLGMLGIGIFVIIYGPHEYPLTTYLMPVIGGVFVAVPALSLLPSDIFHYWAYRKNKARDRVAGVQSADVEAIVEREQSMTDGGLGPRVRDRSWGPHGQYRREALAWGWLFLLVFFVWLIGFLWGTTFFMLLYGGVATRRFFRSWRPRFAYMLFGGGAMWAVTYFSFSLTHIWYTPRIHF